MLYSILMFLACLLAVYGAYSLLACFVDALKIRSCAGSSKVRVIVAVKDVEDQIEFIVRNAVKADLASRLMSGEHIVFVDMGSSDGTFELLLRLQKEYENMYILGPKDRDTAFSPL